MIRARDLIDWANRMATGCTLACPDGWISGEDLTALAEAVIDRAPFDYTPVYTERKEETLD